MSHPLNIYALLVIIGIACMLLVLGLYLLNRRKAKLRFVQEVVVMADGKDRGLADEIPISELSVRKELTPLIHDQPAFILHVANMLERVKIASEMKVMIKAIERIQVEGTLVEAKHGLLRKLREYSQEEHAMKTLRPDLDRADQLKELQHERDILKLKREIEELAQPVKVTAEPREPHPEQESDSFYRTLEHASRVIVQIDQLEKFRSRWYIDLELRYPNDIALQDQLKNVVDQFIDEFKTTRGW